MNTLLKYFAFSFIILFGLFSSKLNAQIQFDLSSSYYLELPYDTTVFIGGNEFTHIGGFSGIDKSNKEDHYYLISDAHTGGIDRGEAQYYEVKIKYKEDICFMFAGRKKIKDSSFWSESIRFSKAGTMFISDERTIDGRECSQVFKVEKDGDFFEIILPEKYQNEMFDNSGFEGITLSPDEDKLYIALERAMPESIYRYITNILEYDLNDLESKPKEYYYPIQRRVKSNGITEILTYNDSILFIMERDYIKPDNFVSIYSVNLNKSVEIPAKYSKLPKDVKLLNPKFLFTFNDVTKIGKKDFKVNNIEGVTFSSSGEYLIFVSDNNFGNRSAQTPTQIVCLKIKSINTIN